MLTLLLALTMETIVLPHMKLKYFPIKKRAVLNYPFYPARSQLSVTEFLQEILEQGKKYQIS